MNRLTNPVPISFSVAPKPFIRFTNSATSNDASSFLNSSPEGMSPPKSGEEPLERLGGDPCLSDPFPECPRQPRYSANGILRLLLDPVEYYSGPQLGDHYKSSFLHNLTTSQSD